MSNASEETFPRDPARDPAYNILTPGEFVAAWRLIHVDFRTGELGDIPEHISLEGATGYLEDLTAENTPRALEILTAFADSPLASDRDSATMYLGDLARNDHDAGMALWHRLIADPERQVRFGAEETLAVGLEETSQGDGFHAVATLHEAETLDHTGLTRQDVYDLYLTYAYAQNGVCFDLGHAAVAKAVAAGSSPAEPL